MSPVARSLFVWLAPLSLFVVAAVLLFPFTADDGYILARYSENLVDQGELAFNSGEPISALTSPLHALIAAAYYRIDGDSILTNKVVSLFLVLVSAGWCAVDLQRRGRRDLAPVAVAIIACSPYVILWAVGGLETPYVLMLVTSLTLVTRAGGYDAARGSTGRAVIIGLLIALAFTHHMMFGFRLLLPFLPTVLLAIIDLLRWGPDDAAHTQNPIAAAAAWAVLALVGLQATLTVVVYRVGINFGAIPSEYRFVSVRSYVNEFVPGLRDNAIEAREHWKSLPLSRDRAPRIFTCAAGVLPYYWRDAYTFEVLVSYRHRSTFNAPNLREAAAADYIQIIAPRHGLVEHQLPSNVDGLVEVSRRTIVFDGRTEDLIVFYNPRPLANRLPPTIDGSSVERNDE